MIEQLVILAAGLLVWLAADPDVRRRWRVRQRARRIADRRRATTSYDTPIEVRERARLLAQEQAQTDTISWCIANGREPDPAVEAREEIRRRIRDLDAHVAGGSRSSDS
jgi:hypothetical protein